MCTVRSCRNGVGPVTANKSTGGAGVGSNFNCVNNEPWDTQHVHKHQEDRQKHTSAGIPFRIFILLK